MRRLGDLEAVIMDRLWSWRRSVTVREVTDDLRKSRTIAYTTVMTVMDTLYRKGILRRERDGRAYRYDAVMTREDHTARLMESVLADSRDRTATMVRFVEQLSPAEAAQLRTALDDVADRADPPRSARV